MISEYLHSMATMGDHDAVKLEKEKKKTLVSHCETRPPIHAVRTNTVHK